jgi:hypothetical protein
MRSTRKQDSYSEFAITARKKWPSGPSVEDPATTLCTSGPTCRRGSVGSGFEAAVRRGRSNRSARRLIGSLKVAKASIKRNCGNEPKRAAA